MRWLTTLREDLAGLPEPARWTALAALLTVSAAILFAPSWALAQAGCGGTAYQITNLDNLLKTAWEYLTSGSVIRILAAAFFIFGVGALISRRPSAAVVGILAGAITAFAPNILSLLISAGKAEMSLCG